VYQLENLIATLSPPGLVSAGFDIQAQLWLGARCEQVETSFAEIHADAVASIGLVWQA
jgi:hypothetical protein